MVNSRKTNQININATLFDCFYKSITNIFLKNEELKF